MSAVRELYEQTLRQIAELEEAARIDLGRLAAEYDRKKWERVQFCNEQTSHLHDLRRKLADQLSDEENLKPLIFSQGEPT